MEVSKTSLVAGLAIKNMKLPSEASDKLNEFHLKYTTTLLSMTGSVIDNSQTVNSRKRTMTFKHFTKSAGNIH